MSNSNLCLFEISFKLKFRTSLPKTSKILILGNSLKSDLSKLANSIISKFETGLG